MKLGTLMQLESSRSHMPIKNCEFKKLKMTPAAILKKSKHRDISAMY